MRIMLSSSCSNLDMVASTKIHLIIKYSGIYSHQHVWIQLISSLRQPCCPTIGYMKTQVHWSPATVEATQPLRPIKDPSTGGVHFWLLRLKQTSPDFSGLSMTFLIDLPRFRSRLWEHRMPSGRAKLLGMLRWKRTGWHWRAIWSVDTHGQTFGSFRFLGFPQIAISEICFEFFWTMV